MAETCTAGALGSGRVALELALATDKTGGEPLLVPVGGGGGGGGGHAAVGERRRQSRRQVAACGLVVQSGGGNADSLEFRGVEAGRGVHSLDPSSVAVSGRRVGGRWAVRQRRMRATRIQLPRRKMTRSVFVLLFCLEGCRNGYFVVGVHVVTLARLCCILRQ